MRLALWLVPPAIAVAMVVAVAAAARAAHSDGSPIRPPGAWEPVWVAALIAAFALYVAGVFVARRSTLAAALVVAAVVQLAPLFGPLLLSRDVYLYWAQARVVTVHHADPYRVTPSRYPGDPATQWASAQWRTQTEAYGPEWVALAAAPATAAGTSHRRAELAFRVFSVLGLLLAIVLLARTTRDPRAVALVGWSPLVALHSAGGGHIDPWLAIALVAAVALRDTAAGGAAWPLGASIKPVPAVLLPLELARARLRFPRRFWAGLVGVGVALVVVSTALFGTRWATASSVGAHTASPIGGVHFLTEAGLRHRYAVAFAGLAFAVVYLVLLREAWVRGRARLALAAAAFCFCSSLLRPWYALWPLALAAAEDDALGTAAALALSAYVLFGDAI